MRMASFIATLCGAGIGILFAFLVIAIGGVAGMSGGGGHMYQLLGFSGILACLAAVTISSIHFSGNAQVAMAVGLFVTAVWHLVSIGMFGVPGFLFLLTGAILATRREHSP